MKQVVTTIWGKVEGEPHAGTQVFRGIPFAQPPVGALRFRPPQPPSPWYGVRPARRFGPSAPQASPVGRLVRQAIGAAASAQSEDCLYLNVWTPSADGARRPVMVWIHGGAFVMGSGSTGLYSGARLARRGDLVVVTLNYRLGALGFLNLPALELGDERAAANLGIRDQIAALEWVRDNIEAFGGDPERVTIFGESAGAMSVGTLLGVPRAEGLFDRAILQSGAATNVSTRTQAAEIAEHCVGELGLAARSGRGLLDALLALPVSELVRAQRATAQSLGIALGILPWQPSVDGELLPEAPLDALAKGRARPIPVLAGTNRDEWKLFMLGDPKGRRLDEDGLRRRLARALPAEDGRPTPAERAYDFYRRLDGSPRPSPPTERWVAFQSDRIFHFPAHRLVDLHSRAGAPAYHYRFDWTPPLLGDRIGACHGLEIPFVFGTLRDPFLRSTLGLLASARELSRRMQDAWIGFAHTGYPGHSRLPHWPSYDPGRRSAMILAADCHVRESPFARRSDFWEDLSHV